MTEVPGYDWTGEFRTDYADYGVLYDAGGSMWGEGHNWTPAAADPAMSNAARLDPVRAAPGGKTVERMDGRYPFRYNPTLSAQNGRLQHGLGVSDAWAQRGHPNNDGTVGYGAIDYPGQSWSTERFGGAGAPSGPLADPTIQVLFFLIILYFAMQTMVTGAVRAALAEVRRDAART